jgi:hypothetical protein
VLPEAGRGLAPSVAVGVACERSDKWLVPGGLIIPDKATIHLAAIEDGEYKVRKEHVVLPARRCGRLAMAKKRMAWFCHL